MICGDELTYLHIGKEFRCEECGVIEFGYVFCENGHYVCDGCHGRRSFKDILGLIASAEGSNPLSIAMSIIDNADIPMLGCEHAWIAAGALFSGNKQSWRNKYYRTATY